MKPFLLALGLIFCTGLILQAEDWESLATKGEKAMTSSKYEEAITFFSAAFLLNPDEPSILGNRGNCYSLLNRLDEAQKDYDQAIRIELKNNNNQETPYLCYFYYNKAYAYDRRDRHAEAVPWYEKVIVLDKNYPDAHGNLAWILATSFDPKLRNPKRAIELARIEGDRQSWKEPDSFDNLAAAYAADGVFDEAVKNQLEALKLEKSESGKKQFQERLELYQKKQPFVQTKKE